VATDGHRLVRYANKGLVSPESLFFIVPDKALTQIGRALHGDGCSLTISDAHAVFESGQTVVITRLINEQYPNYEAVIPRENEKSLLVEKDQMMSTVKRVSVFSSTTTRQIRLELGQDQLVIRAEDLDMSSEAKETVACDYAGETMEIGFNARYLVDVLNNVDGDSVRFEFSTPNRAGIVKPEQDAADEEMLMLVMPVMLNTY
jgi:DNA polymerase-3 subunit beta